MWFCLITVGKGQHWTQTCKIYFLDSVWKYHCCKHAKKKKKNRQTKHFSCLELRWQLRCCKAHICITGNRNVVCEVIPTSTTPRFFADLDGIIFVSVVWQWCWAWGKNQNLNRRLNLNWMYNTHRNGIWGSVFHPTP